MTSSHLSDEQKAIIKEESNCVVIATPGSGKTFTLSQKCRKIISSLPDYRGIIAISYTNKASNELKHRTILNNLNPKNSFFGTIDKFCVIEIIIPFGKHVFGKPKEEFDIRTSSDIATKFINYAQVIKEIKESNSSLIDENHIEVISSLYSSHGIIILDFIALTANYILSKSISCNKYLHARYSHIIIDEFQDSDFEQNKLFIHLVESNMIGIAVGDLRQAIFLFAKKESKYLNELQDRENFECYKLTHNYRCHPSISNYSKIFLQIGLEETVNTAELLETDKTRICEKRVIGNEIEVAKWIESIIPKITTRLAIKDYEKIGILVKSNYSAKRVHDNLTLPHRIVFTNSLDEDVSLWSNLFGHLLSFCFDDRKNSFEILDEYYDIYGHSGKTRKLIGILDKLRIRTLEYDCQDGNPSRKKLLSLFFQVAKVLYPLSENSKSKLLLENVLKENELLINYFPPKKNELQIMTLFKSKGLEFDLVFHLDLYEFILPKRKKGKGGQWNDFESIEQDLNLHYVGITRAKHCCVLVHSTRRTANSGERDAKPSEFLSQPKYDLLKQYRLNFK